MVRLLRQQSVPSMAFLSAGIVFAGARLIATRPLIPIIGVMARGRFLELSWLGVGMLVCSLYAMLYFASARFLNRSVSMGLWLVHLLITLAALFGLGELHHISIRTEQSPGTYNPSTYSQSLAFLGVHAFTLLLVSGLLFLAIIVFSWLLKTPTPSH
jgi:hypothetical protein